MLPRGRCAPRELLEEVLNEDRRGLRALRSWTSAFRSHVHSEPLPVRMQVEGYTVRRERGTDDPSRGPQLRLFRFERLSVNGVARDHDLAACIREGSIAI